MLCIIPKFHCKMLKISTVILKWTIFFTFLEPASGGNMFFDFFYAINEEKLKTNFLFAYFGAYKKMLKYF